jgi:O-antigen/teichoic acid export membrane protein
MINKLKKFLYKILRGSEKYTKTDMVYLARGHFWLISGQIISTFGTFVLALVFANFLTKEAYGTYKYVLSVASLLAITNLSGMDQIITQSVARGLEGGFIKGLKAKIKYGALGSVAALGVATYYYLHHNILLTFSFLIVGTFLPFMESFNVYDNFLLAKKQFKISAIYKTISQITSATILIIILLLSSNPLLVILFYYLSWTILRFTFLKKSLKKFPPNKVEDPQAINYSRHISFINITAVLVGSADSLILYHYLGASQLAVYAFAIAPISQLRSLFDKIPVLALPKFANKPISEIHKYFWKRFWLLMTIGSLITLIYILLAPFLYRIFFPQYQSSVLYSQVFSITILLVLCQSVLTPVLSSRLTSTPKKLLYLWNIPNTVMVVAMVILVYHFGIMGVVISRLLSTLTSIIINFVSYFKLKKIESQGAPNILI